MAMKYPVPMLLPLQSRSIMALMMELSTWELQASRRCCLVADAGRLWKQIRSHWLGGQSWRFKRLWAIASRVFSYPSEADQLDQSRGLPNSLQYQSEHELSSDLLPSSEYDQLQGGSSGCPLSSQQFPCQSYHPPYRSYRYTCSLPFIINPLSSSNSVKLQNLQGW